MARSRAFRDPDFASEEFSFTDIPNLALWYDGSDPLGTGVAPANNATVPTLVDKSGNGFNATQSTDTPTFNTSAFNSRPAILIDDGNLGYEISTGFNLTSGNYTLFFVSQQEDNTGGTFDGIYLFDSNASGQRLLLTQFSKPAADFLYFIGVGEGPGFGTTAEIQSTYVFDGVGGTGTVRRDGSQIFSDSYTSRPIGNGATIGERFATFGTNNFQGVIAEVLVYNRTLTAGEIALVEQELQSKWGL